VERREERSLGRRACEGLGLRMRGGVLIRLLTGPATHGLAVVEDGGVKGGAEWQISTSRFVLFAAWIWRVTCERFSINCLALEGEMVISVVSCVAIVSCHWRKFV
jgi:hypothetical protein